MYRGSWGEAHRDSSRDEAEVRTGEETRCEVAAGCPSGETGAPSEVEPCKAATNLTEPLCSHCASPPL